jgi:vacuolar protein sorting-associated protein 13A/C
LRREALDKLELPLVVREGYLGELQITIPWQSLRNKPVQVRIRDVFLLAGPKEAQDVQNYNDDVVIFT